MQRTLQELQLLGLVEVTSERYGSDRSRQTYTLATRIDREALDKLSGNVGTPVGGPR